jgi:hypothetical protein
MPVAAKNCMCATPPAPAPAVSPHPRVSLRSDEVAADRVGGWGLTAGVGAGGVAHLQFFAETTHPRSYVVPATPASGRGHNVGCCLLKVLQES